MCMDIATTSPSEPLAVLDEGVLPALHATGGLERAGEVARKDELDEAGASRIVELPGQREAVLGLAANLGALGDPAHAVRVVRHRQRLGKRTLHAEERKVRTVDERKNQLLTVTRAFGIAGTEHGSRA